MPGVQKWCTNFETQIGGKKFPIKFAIILWKADCLLSRHPFLRPIPVGMGLFEHPTAPSHENCPQGLLLTGSAEGFGSWSLLQGS